MSYSNCCSYTIDHTVGYTSASAAVGAYQRHIGNSFTLGVAEDITREERHPSKYKKVNIFAWGGTRYEKKVAPTLFVSNNQPVYDEKTVSRTVSQAQTTVEYTIGEASETITDGETVITEADFSDLYQDTDHEENTLATAEGEKHGEVREADGMAITKENCC